MTILEKNKIKIEAAAVTIELGILLEKMTGAN